MLDIIFSLSIFALINLGQHLEEGVATGGGGESGYSAVRKGETKEGQAERVKQGQNFPETGTAKDAYKRPFDATDTQPERTTTAAVESALSEDGDFSVPLNEYDPDPLFTLDTLGAQADLDVNQKTFGPIAENDSDMKKQDDSAVYNDRKGDNNKTAMVSEDDYKAQFTEPYGKPRKPENGDTNYQIDETLDKQQAGAKAREQKPKYTDPSSNKLDSSVDKALVGDPLQQ